jgi:hypothetical protein
MNQLLLIILILGVVLGFGTILKILAFSIMSVLGLPLLTLILIFLVVRALR